MNSTIQKQIGSTLCIVFNQQHLIDIQHFVTEQLETVVDTVSLSVLQPKHNKYDKVITSSFKINFQIKNNNLKDQYGRPTC